MGKSAHPPSLCASSLSKKINKKLCIRFRFRLRFRLFSLAPSALYSSVNPPTSGLGFFRSSPTLASSRGTEAHVLPSRGAGVSSRATRLSSSIARSGTGQSISGGRFRVSLPRGVFVERGTTVAFDDPSLAESYLEDLDYVRFGHSQFPLVLDQPPFSLARSIDLDCFSVVFEPDVFPVLLHIHLALRLRPSTAVFWGTCIAFTESLRGLSHSRGEDRRHVQIFLMKLASLTIQVSDSRRFSCQILPIWSKKKKKILTNIFSFPSLPSVPSESW